MNIENKLNSHSIISVKYDNGLPIMYTSAFAISAIAEDLDGDKGEYFTMQMNMDNSVLCNGMIIKAFILIICISWCQWSRLSKIVNSGIENGVYWAIYEYNFSIQFNTSLIYIGSPGNCSGYLESFSCNNEFQNFEISESGQSGVNASSSPGYYIGIGY